MKRPASAAPSSSDRVQAPTSCSSSERGAAALRSFFSSAAASNAGSAAQPAAATSRGSTAASSNPRSAERPADADAAQPAESSNATAQAAAEEECFRAVVDLREVAQKLDKHQFQDKAKLLENVDNKAMFVTARAFATYLIPWCVGRWVRVGSASRAFVRQRRQPVRPCQLVSARNGPGPGNRPRPRETIQAWGNGPGPGGPGKRPTSFEMAQAQGNGPAPHV